MHGDSGYFFVPIQVKQIQICEKKNTKEKHLERKYNLGEVKYPIKNNYEVNQAMRQKKIMYHEVSQFEEAQI